MNEIKLSQFMNVFGRKLAENHKANPDCYVWPIERLPLVIEKTKHAIINGAFVYQSISMKDTCKELGIKNTRKAILEFLK